MIEELAKGLAGAMLAQKLAQQAMEEFAVCAAAYDFDGAEQARLRAVSHLEAYFDHLAAAYKKLQRS